MSDKFIDFNDLDIGDIEIPEMEVPEPDIDIPIPESNEDTKSTLQDDDDLFGETETSSEPIKEEIKKNPQKKNENPKKEEKKKAEPKKEEPKEEEVSGNMQEKKSSPTKENIKKQNNAYKSESNIGNPKVEKSKPPEPEEVEGEEFSCGDENAPKFEIPEEEVRIHTNIPNKEEDIETIEVGPEDVLGKHFELNPKILGVIKKVGLFAVVLIIVIGVPFMLSKALKSSDESPTTESSEETSTELDILGLNQDNNTEEDASTEEITTTEETITTEVITEKPSMTADEILANSELKAEIINKLNITEAPISADGIKSSGVGMSDRFSSIDDLSLYITSSNTTVLSTEKQLVNKYINGTISKEEFSESMTTCKQGINEVVHLLMINKTTYITNGKSLEYTQTETDIINTMLYGDIATSLVDKDTPTTEIINTLSIY